METKPALPAGVVFDAPKSEPAAAPDPSKPDAIQCKPSDKEVIANAANLIDLPKGSPCVRGLPGGQVVFISQSIDDTLQFPRAHPHAGNPRYRWETQADGTQFGFKVQGADDVG